MWTKTLKFIDDGVEIDHVAPKSLHHALYLVSFEILWKEMPQDKLNKDLTSFLF